MNDEKYFEMMSNVLNASIALMGLCLTIISLFQISDKRALYQADEFFSVSAALFFISLLSAYIYTRRNAGLVFKRTADQFFLLALIGMMISGIYLAFEL
jgi:hypothetical protein